MIILIDIYFLVTSLGIIKIITMIFGVKSGNRVKPSAKNLSEPCNQDPYQTSKQKIEVSTN